MRSSFINKSTGLLVVLVCLGWVRVAGAQTAPPPGANESAVAAPGTANLGNSNGGASSLPRATVHQLLLDPAVLRERLASQSYDVLASKDRLAQAEASVGSARLVPNPSLDAALTGVPVSQSHDARFRTSSAWSVGLSQTVELGKRGPRTEAATLRQQAAQQELRATLGERLGVARLALANTLHLALRLKTLRESLADAERASGLERVRYEQKALSGMDYDRLLLDLDALRSDVLHSEAEFQAALAECSARLLARCDLTESAEQDLVSALPLVLQNGEANLRTRPDVMQFGFEQRAAVREAEYARRRALPDLTFRVGYTRDNAAGTGEALDSISVGLSLPLPISDHGQYDARRALARASEMDHQRSAVLADARAELTGLLLRKAALENTVGVLERDSIPRAEGVLNSTQQAFDHGGISLTDLLLARRTYVALRLRLLEERFELFTLRNDLYRVLGIDTRGAEK
ncbi:MAG TPA: TolC family protein [Polyangiaceae bacterium]|nr:TolC family protein [Polyangiaceae bacterium]